MSKPRYVIYRIGPDDSDGDPAPCADCEKDTEPMKPNGKPDFFNWDFYMVPTKTWQAAGMGPEYSSGFLCSPCLSRRLGRGLVMKDFLFRSFGARDGCLVLMAQADYAHHLWSGGTHSTFGKLYGSAVT